MVKQHIHVKPRMPWLVASLFALAALPAAMAQPGSNSANQFGDRQTGHWGDPGQGYFGNPAVGNFDQSKMREPPPGTRPLGKVYRGQGPELSPYISLPTPADAAMEIPPPEFVKPIGSTTKKPTKKQAARKTG